MVSLSGAARASRMNAEPMNPAPPVIRSFMKSGLPAFRRRCLRGSGYQVARPQQGIEGTGIRPPTFQPGKRHRAFADIGIVDIGDFQFAAAGRDKRMDLAEDRGIVHVNAGDSIVRTGTLRLLFDADDS